MPERSTLTGPDVTSSRSGPMWGRPRPRGAGADLEGDRRGAAVLQVEVDRCWALARHGRAARLADQDPVDDDSRSRGIAGHWPR
jgi:hypothetical protein